VEIRDSREKFYSNGRKCQYVEKLECSVLWEKEVGPWLLGGGRRKVREG
jgi:hypothetical protein